MTAIVNNLLNVVLILVCVVFGAALLTWLERRLLGIWQDRCGPNRVGPYNSGSTYSR